MLINKSKTAMRVLREKGLASVFNLLKHHFGFAKHVDEGKLILDWFKSISFKGTLVDIGAHRGYDTIPFASEGWKVFAFEPDPVNRAQLEQLVLNLSSVHVDARAVADKSAQHVAFYKSRESDGVSGLQAFLPSHQAEYHVDVTTLTEFVLEKAIDEIDFLKIDTEGYDKMVLDGIPWESLRPRLILCEFEDKKTLPLGYSYHDLANSLLEKAYHLIVSEWKPIKRYGEKHDWRGFYPYPHELQTPKAWGNLIAARDKADYESLSQFLKV